MKKKIYLFILIFTLFFVTACSGNTGKQPSLIPGLNKGDKTNTPAPSATNTSAPSATAFDTPTPTNTSTPTNTPTPTATNTPTPTPIVYTYEKLEPTVMYTYNGANIRFKPDTIWDITNYLYEGTQVTVTEKCIETGWYKITFGKNQTGYCYPGSLTTEPPITVDTSTVTPVPVGVYTASGFITLNLGEKANVALTGLAFENFKSYDMSVVSVSESGEITPLRAGKAVVSAFSGGTEYFFDVSVFDHNRLAGSFTTVREITDDLWLTEELTLTVTDVVPFVPTQVPTPSAAPEDPNVTPGETPSVTADPTASAENPSATAAPTAPTDPSPVPAPSAESYLNLFANGELKLVRLTGLKLVSENATTYTVAYKGMSFEVDKTKLTNVCPGATPSPELPAVSFSIKPGMLVNYNNVLLTTADPTGLVNLVQNKTVRSLTGGASCLIQQEALNPLCVMGRECIAFGEGSWFWIEETGAYRPFELQDYYWNNAITKDPTYGDTPYTSGGTKCVPGISSEHRTGYAFDISTSAKGYEWLNENSWKYGFIHRYTGDKTIYTGVMDEYWHYTYVGRDIAETCYKEGLCLEEYYEKYVFEQSISQ